MFSYLHSDGQSLWVPRVFLFPCTTCTANVSSEVQSRNNHERGSCNLCSWHAPLINAYGNWHHGSHVQCQGCGSSQTRYQQVRSIGLNLCKRCAVLSKLTTTKSEHETFTLKTPTRKFGLPMVVGSVMVFQMVANAIVDQENKTCTTLTRRCTRAREPGHSWWRILPSTTPLGSHRRIARRWHDGYLILTQFVLHETLLTSQKKWRLKSSRHTCTRMRSKCVLEKLLTIISYPVRGDEAK